MPTSNHNSSENVTDESVFVLPLIPLVDLSAEEADESATVAALSSFEAGYSHAYVEAMD